MAGFGMIVPTTQTTGTGGTVDTTGFLVGTMIMVGEQLVHVASATGDVLDTDGVAPTLAENVPVSTIVIPGDIRNVAGQLARRFHQLEQQSATGSMEDMGAPALNFRLQRTLNTYVRPEWA